MKICLTILTYLRMLTALSDVRYVSGIEFVSHNMVFSPTLHWSDERDLVEVSEPNRLRKRWNKLESNLPWWTRMAAKWVDDSVKQGVWGRAVSSPFRYSSLSFFAIITPQYLGRD
jgi:hypothetical protein